MFITGDSAVNTVRRQAFDLESTAQKSLVTVLFVLKTKLLGKRTKIVYAGDSLTHFSCCVASESKCWVMTDFHVPGVTHSHHESVSCALVCSGSSLFVGGKALKEVQFFKPE